MPICSQTMNRERQQLSSILVVENHINVWPEKYLDAIPYEQHGFGTPDGRTKIMELPSIGERLNYTWRSYSVTLYRMHACACTSLPRLTSGLRESRKLYLVHRRACPYEQPPCLVFFYSLRFQMHASLFQTL